MEDKRNILHEEKPFTYRMLKTGNVQIFYNGRLIKTLSKSQSSKLASISALGDEYELQLFMAKATGNFKHGNER